MSNIQIFSYEDNAIEFEMIDGQLYANATAMCRVFGRQPKDWLRTEQTMRYVETIRLKCLLPNTECVIVRNGGFNPGTWIHEKLILKLATWLDTDFDLWCQEKLSELLRTGTAAIYHLPQTKVEALRALAEEIEAHEATQLQLEAAKPKLEQYERVMNAEGTFSLNDVAKMIGTGQNRLFGFLRAQNVLFYLRQHNVPYQNYIDNGWFIVRQEQYQRGNTSESYPRLFVTPKGVEGIRRKWDKAHASTAIPVFSTPTPTQTASA